MSEYGWEIYDESGRLLYDDSVVMSKWLGSYQIPIITQGGGNWSLRINNIPFRDGTPFTWCVATPNIIIPDKFNYAYSPPNVYCAVDYIDISYNDRILSFPDDLGYGLALGGITVHWGVYNGR